MLQLTDVTKAYGERPAVDDVSFAVPAGSLTGCSRGTPRCWKGC